MSLLFPTGPGTGLTMPKAPKITIDKAPDYSKALTATKNVATPFDKTWTNAQTKLGGRLQTQQSLIPGMEVGIAPVWAAAPKREDLVKTISGGNKKGGKGYNDHGGSGSQGSGNYSGGGRGGSYSSSRW
jgi:hypothetical protein